MNSDNYGVRKANLFTKFCAKSQIKHQLINVTNLIKQLPPGQ